MCVTHVTSWIKQSEIKISDMVCAVYTKFEEFGKTSNKQAILWIHS